MATNFNLKSTDEHGAVIRLLIDSYLVDCRFPEGMPDAQRMAWLKQTANEALRNRGHADLVDDDPASTPDFDETVEETSPSFWTRVAGWFS